MRGRKPGLVNPMLELRAKHVIEELADFLCYHRTINNQSIREIPLVEFQQRTAQKINTLGDKSKSQQDRIIVQLVQYDRSYMGDN